MLCQNCGENEANVRYTQIVNGVKKEMALCEKCSHELGIGDLDFSMPINFSSFLGDFFEEEKEFLPSFIKQEKLICDKCGMTYDEFIDTGKFGCENCYEVFSEKVDPILKNIQTGNRHIGRGIEKENKSETKINNETCRGEHCSSANTNINAKAKDNAQDNTINKQLEKLKQDLKIAIQEELYEDAAKIRDEIKKYSK